MKASNKFEAGSKEKFTGEVLLADLSDDVRLYHVVFTPAARTHWHVHSEGQTIIIASGIAWIGFKEEGKIFKKVLSSGESYHFKPGLEHWHGASPGGVMEHFAITRGVTDWKSPVREEEYYTDSDYDITIELTNLAYAFSEAEINKDIEFFNDHLSEDLIFRRVSGKIANKNSSIEDLKKLRYDYNIPTMFKYFRQRINYLQLFHSLSVLK